MAKYTSDSYHNFIQNCPGALIKERERPMKFQSKPYHQNKGKSTHDFGTIAKMDYFKYNNDSMVCQDSSLSQQK